MKCRDLLNLIEEFAPPSAAAAWDNSGMQVAGEYREIKKVAVALDPDLRTVNLALDFKADFLLCHHPLSLTAQFLSQNNNYTTIARRILSSGLWLYSAHTSLDANPKGSVRWLADELTLLNLQFLEPFKPANEGESNAPQSAYGFGFVGDLPKPLAWPELLLKLKKLLPAGVWRACGPEVDLVRRVACCPGSGGDLWLNAVSLNADILITGDVKYHTALDARLCVLDVGHFSLEEEMMRRFMHALANRAKNVEFTFLAADDPLRPVVI